MKIGRFPFAGNSRATILGNHDGFVKVVADEKYGEILGVHIIGPEAFELIAEAVAAMEAEATVDVDDADYPRAPHALRSGGRGFNAVYGLSINACRAASVRVLGRIDYGAALELQQQLVAKRKQALIPDQLLLLEHPHVMTLGRNGHMENLLASEEVLDRAGIAFYPTDRGGDVTYHGPGQLVGYPILDLRDWKRDVGAYVRGHGAGDYRYAGGFRHRRRAAFRS